MCGMFEVKRDAAADLAMCEAATPGKWEGKHAIQPYISVFTGVAEEVIATTYTRGNMRFIAESRTALPHWINRAVAAEAEVERLRGILVNVHGALYGGYIFDPTITAQIENALNGK